MNNKKVKVAFWGILMVLVIIFTIYLKTNPEKLRNIGKKEEPIIIENEQDVEDSKYNPNIKGVQ